MFKKLIRNIVGFNQEIYVILFVRKQVGYRKVEKTILVVDDDVDIRRAIRIYLEQDNLNVIEAQDGFDAIEKLKDNDVHLIIMDVMMPNLDGIHATQKIREISNVPILMLTAKSEDVDKILGLQTGADDYITKPFSPLELMARVRSMLRRYMVLGEFDKKQSESVLQVGGLALNKETKIVSVDGECVKLTPKEFKITELLMSNPGRVFSIDDIYEKVWGEAAFNSDNTVSVHVRKIREKIEEVPNKPKYLKVVWGVGYKIEAE